MYYVQGIGVNGCPGIDSIFIYYLPNPTLSVNSATICSGDSIVLIAETDQPGGGYTWSSGLGTDSMVVVSPNSKRFLYSLTTRVQINVRVIRLFQQFLSYQHLLHQ